jgi:hypothetical protein
MERPTMIRKIATAGVYVEDQQRAVQFWTKQVGFEVRRERPMGPDARWIEAGPPGADCCLVIYPKSLMPDWTERKPGASSSAGSRKRCRGGRSPSFWILTETGMD